jgi:uncharacterized membrane protein
MAALAIDVVSLYAARGEVQRAADAAALVAAKAFVDSGVTSDPANASLQTLAENMANAGITGIPPQNKVAGSAPVQVGAYRYRVGKGGGLQSREVANNNGELHSCHAEER